MSTSFTALQLPDPLLSFIEQRKMEQPTPIQAEAIPAMLAGKDILAESPTGSGKTLAYLLPIAAKLVTDTKDIQALVLAPTHELVMQIAREAEQVLATRNLQAMALIGGVDVKRQVEKLKTKPALIVATPGRLKELLEQKKVKIHMVKTVVVDEADRMLDEGFAAPVRDILKRTMRDTQRVFFSATIPAAISQMVESFVQDPLIIRTSAPESKFGVHHMYLVTEGRGKVDTLRRLLRLVNARSSIVFVNTLEKVEEIVAKLNYHHLECKLLHRDASKEERALTLQRFRSGELPVLIATDVAARGIDIPGIECVVHFDPASDADAYIHRSGRTGRMGAAGLVFSIITPDQRFILEKFAKKANVVIEPKEMSHGALVDPQERKKTGPRPAAKAKTNDVASKGTKNSRKPAAAQGPSTRPKR